MPVITVFDLIERVDWYICGWATYGDRGGVVGQVLGRGIGP